MTESESGKGWATRKQLDGHWHINLKGSDLPTAMPCLCAMPRASSVCTLTVKWCCSLAVAGRAPLFWYALSG